MGILNEDPNIWVRRYRERRNGVRHYGYNDAREAMSATTDSRPIIGLDMQHNPVHVDLHSDSPHILISMGSGGGKSVAMKTLLAQFARNGAHTVILDYKRHSHRWARRVPSVTYCRDIEDIHDTLLAIADLAMERYKAADKLSDEEFERGEWMGDRVVVAVEEMNAMMSELEDYWTEIRTKNAGNRFWQVPRRSPAVKALHKLLSMGRAANVNVVAVAQRASVASMGGGSSYGASGGDARENFAVRILARYTHSTWKMLIPDCDYVPPSEHIGRAQVARGADATETQILYLTDDEAVEWAMRKDEMDAT